MTTSTELLDNVIAWAARDANVRRLLLVGSRAHATPPDDLADFDVQVYADSHEPYIQDQGWLSGIGRVWVCVPDKYLDRDIEVPTRLVIFDGGLKVDFAFYPAGHVSTGVSAGLPHQVLLHRDRGTTSSEPQQLQLRSHPLPNEATFRRVVEEFWFEAYHVGKYLARHELWLAKSRDWATKQCLLTMIGWHEQVVRGRLLEAEWVGQRSCVSPATWEAVYPTFGSFEHADSWRAAFATIKLFRQLAVEVAAATRFTYPADLDGSVGDFIQRLRDGQAGTEV